MNETKNNIPNYIEEAYQEFVSGMKKFRTLIITAREYISSFLINSNKEDGIPYLQISLASLFLRQAIKLLIFSNLLIDKRKYEIILKCKNWRIEKVIQGIEEVNKNWFPKAITIIEKEWTIEEINNLKIDINFQPKNIYELIKKQLIKMIYVIFMIIYQILFIMKIILKKAKNGVIKILFKYTFKIIMYLFIIYAFN